jgi:muramidase (phage lysozyme)
MNEFFSNMIFTNPRLKTNNYKFTLKNFVKSSQDLFSINQLEKYNIDSVIIGTELNNNIFPCQKIWRKIESKLEEKLLPKI